MVRFIWWAAAAALLIDVGEVRAEILRLADSVAPTYQEVFLKLDPAQPDFSGSVRIDLEVRQPVRSFRVHATTARIGTIVLRDSLGLVPATVDSVDEDEQVTIHCSRALVVGRAVLGLVFTNVYDTHAIGLYHAEAAGDWYALSQMEPDDCRLAFPCFDEPGFKIPWQFTLEIPDSLSAVTNQPEESRAPGPAGWRKIVFRKTPPMPPYLVAIAVGPLEFVDVPGTSRPVRIVTARGQSGHVSL
ncbi:MAG: aminopeptidase, partial [bacterium]